MGNRYRYQSSMPRKHEMIMESDVNDLYRFLLLTDDKPWYIPRETRRYLIDRYKFTCAICLRTYFRRYDMFHIDHILPVARGGKAVIDNLQVLCRRCNLQKSDNYIDPESYNRGYVIPIFIESERKINEKIMEKIQDELK